MTTREWKVEALWYILRSKEWSKSPYRQEREYADYLRRFFFGDEEISFDGHNEVWKKRKATLDLPMPTNVYLYM